MINNAALSGVRVLDLTHVQAGPSASQLLAWMGADVIKIESPTGDVTRRQLLDIPDTDGLYFNMMNCNKRSIVIDLKSEQGKAVFTKLLKKSDILIENFGPGVMHRLGLAWDQVHKINPAIIMGSIKGFGSQGPYAKFKAYDNISQAMGGSMSTTGFSEDTPLVTGSQVGDIGSGLHLLIGVLGALHARNNSGQGQYVEVAMMDAVMNFCRIKFRDHQRLKQGPLSEYMTPTADLDYAPRSGNESGGSNMGAALKCKPGGANDYVYIVIQDSVWAKLANLIGGQELVNDQRFSTLDNRNRHQDIMWGIIETFTNQHSKFEIMNMLTDLDIPCGPVMSTQDLVNDEHVKLRDMIVHLEHPQRGSWFNVGMPIKMSHSSVPIQNPPGLGQHTQEILKEVLGWTTEQIEKYEQQSANS